jgi:hypothetical protein
MIAIYIAIITRKRGSAKHCAKDEHAFLRKHSIFRLLPCRNPQPINVKFCTIDMSARLRDVPKMVGIGLLGAIPQIGQI